jgi:hypothetical protein
MVVDGTKLGILIGLCSQTCRRTIPEYFSREIEDGGTKDRFVKRLVVDVLNARIQPRTCCPGTSLAIDMMKRNFPNGYTGSDSDSDAGSTGLMLHLDEVRLPVPTLLLHVWL